MRTDSPIAFALRQAGSALAALAFVGATQVGLAVSAHALVIELKDVAADRVERQRAAAAGLLPLPNTPNIADFNDRLREKGLSMSAPILIRLFKTESELEIWKEKNGAFVLFATYPICHWSGSLGPKMRDGDKQAPEGFYAVDRALSRHVGRWPRSLNLGFPNIYDQSLARTGDNILIHGGCSSVGCFAMTNPVMDEIHNLTTAAIESGQEFVPVHVFPFRMTDERMKEHAESPWAAFWTNLKEGYDAFEKTHKAFAVNVCEGHYQIQPVEHVSQAGGLQACPPTLTGIREQDEWLRDVPPPNFRKIEGTATPRPPLQPSLSEAAAQPPG